jgi:small-conductance mechanosensitive channel
MTFVLSLAAYSILFILIRVINRRVGNLKSRHTIRKNAVYLVNFLLIIAVVFVWLQRLNSLSIFLGFASAGLALALQEVILSVAGWFLIIARHPFEVGDRIELGDVKGDVIDIRVLQTSLLEIGNWVDADQSTGRIVNIPNSFVFKKPNFNYNRGFEFIWNEIPLTITFESDWRRGRDIMLAHAQKMAEGLEEKAKHKIDQMTSQYMIYYEKFTPIVYVDIKDNGVRLTLRYLTEAKKRRSTTDELSSAILDDFAKEANVNLAYNTFRIVQS